MPVADRKPIITWTGLTCNIDGWFPSDYSEMHRWCKQNCFGQFLVVDFKRIKEYDTPIYFSQKLTDQSFVTEKTLFKLHIKLTDERDIAFFKLKWF